MFALAVAWVPPAAVFAQDAIDVNVIEDVAELSLETLLDTRVMAASRYEQLASEAPSALSVVTADEIRAFGYKTLADVLQAQRGFYATNDRNYTYVGVRGFNIPGDYSSRVLVLIDGHRINDGIYSQAPAGHELVIDLDDVARIELIRGPGSSVYGSNAFFAVINVVTLRGADLRGARATAETSFLDDTHGTPRGDGSRSFTGGRFSLAWGDTFGDLDVVASASYYTSAGVPRLYFPEIDGNPDVTCADAAGAAMPCDGMARDLDDESTWRARAQATYGRFTLRAVIGSRTKRVPTGPFGTIFGDASETVDSRAFAELAYAATRGSWELSARGFYDLYDYVGAYPYDDRMSAEDPLAAGREILDDSARQQGVGAESQIVAKIAPRGVLDSARISAGAEVRHSFQGRMGTTLGRDLLLDTDGTETYLALYTQGEARVAGRLQLNAGLRLDHYFASFGSTLNPRLAAIYTPLSGTRVKLLYGTAFRAPSIFERFFASPKDGFEVNPDLGAEHITTLEAVVEQYLGKHLRATVSAYHYRARGLIAYTEEEEGTAHFENLDRVTTRGLELELEGKWGETRGRVSYAWQRARNPTTGERMVNSPLTQFKLDLVVPVIEKRLSLGLESQYMAARHSLGTVDVPPYFLTNITLVCNAPLPGLTLALSAQNVFDEQYATPGSFDHTQTTLRQDPRTFWLKGDYRF